MTKIINIFFSNRESDLTREPRTLSVSNRLNRRRQLWLPLFVWLVLMILSALPLYLASYLFIGESGFHGVQIGIERQGMIHGTLLTCETQAGNQVCSMPISDVPLEITIPIEGPASACAVTYAGETYVCTRAKVAGENKEFPPEAKNGILIVGEEIEQLIMADKPNWRNWRSLFLGVGREDVLLQGLLLWAIGSLIAGLIFLPRFFGAGESEVKSYQGPTKMFITKLIVVCCLAPAIYFVVLMGMIFFGFVL